MKLSLLSLLLLAILALLTGSVSLSPIEVWHTLWGEGSDTARFIVMDSRLPQLLTAALSGAALAVSGLVMQSLFANPLADPSLLGVNSGASLGAAAAMLLMGGTWSLGYASLSGVMLTMVMAFIGACMVIALLTVCSRYISGNLSLLIAGVMLSFAISALISLLSFYAIADGVRSFVVWGMGDFAGVPLQRIPLFALCVVVPLLLLMLFAQPLNALLLGPDYARNLGINVRRVRTQALLIVGLLTAVVTAMCGPISFIGLAVPHMARLLRRTANHRVLIPLTALLGADVALLSLIISHLPGERGTLPLSAITPFIGVPIVIYILVRRR